MAIRVADRRVTPDNAENTGSPAPRRPVTIVMYHSIHPEVDPYTISPEAFTNQIRYLKRHYSFIRLSEIGGVLEEDTSNTRKIVLTFDDAFLDFMDTVYPLLAEHRIPATVFVPTAFIGGFSDWDLDVEGCRRKRLMSGEQLRTLWQTGLVDFGSHTVHHARMSKLPVDQMQRQAVESKKALEDLLGIAVNMFSYPYGQLDDVPEDAVTAVQEAGYEIAVTTHWGAWNSSDQLLRLRRVYFQDDDSERAVGLKASGLYDWRAAKERMGHAVRNVRRRLTK